MHLTDEEMAILHGEKGDTLAKVMETVVRFGDIFDAPKLVPVTHHEGHLVTSFGIGLLKPLFKTMDELIQDNLKTKGPFTLDPRPIDYKNVKCNLLEKLVFSKIMYSKQDMYEEQLMKVGLKNKNAFSCTCYLDEVGNIPKMGDILSWAESSAVVYANSVLGARCNRNSGMLDLFGSVLGKVPYFGLLTDEGRKATWRVELKTTKLPEAQILGSAIGMKVMEDVPYVIGLDKFLGHELNDETKAYLKDFGAASASNGAIGLYHIDKLTPEAKELGEKLVTKNAKTYVIDDEEIERVYKSYPIMWKKPNKRGNLVFIGCPHLTYSQLVNWTKKIENGLNDANKKKVNRRVIMTCAPNVKEKFMKSEYYPKLISFGVKLSSICPLMYTNNPITHSKRIMTNSNKLRTYSMARYYKDDDLLALITKGEK